MSTSSPPSLLPYWAMQGYGCPCMAEPATTGRVPIWTLADRLVKARHVADLTQDALAHRLEVSKKTIIRAEAGGTVRRSLLIAWALACRVDVSWLLTGDPDNEAEWGDMSPVTLGNPDTLLPLAA